MKRQYSYYYSYSLLSQILSFDFLICTSKLFIFSAIFDQKRMFVRISRVFCTRRLMRWRRKVKKKTIMSRQKNTDIINLLTYFFFTVSSSSITRLSVIIGEKRDNLWIHLAVIGLKTIRFFFVWRHNFYAVHFCTVLCCVYVFLWTSIYIRNYSIEIHSDSF